MRRSLHGIHLFKSLNFQMVLKNDKFLRLILMPRNKSMTTNVCVLFLFLVDGDHSNLERVNNILGLSNQYFSSIKVKALFGYDTIQ